MKVYLASSWRNEAQPTVLAALRAAGHEVYDFKNPRPGDKGFHWSDIDPAWKTWTPTQFREAITNHELAINGFYSDWDAMEWADVGVMLQPCGRSAHIEGGYFVGAKKPLIILLAPDQEPELMLRMAYVTRGSICLDVQEVIRALRNADPADRTEVSQC